jgi:hypothetical protein
MCYHIGLRPGQVAREAVLALLYSGGGYVKRAAVTIGTICIVFAALWFISGAVRIGFMVARANIGLYEAVFVAVIGLALIMSSRRR